MNGYEVIFPSGLSRVLYGKTKDQALESLWEGVKIDCVIDVAENLSREKEFKHEHATLLKSSAVLQMKQEIKAKVETEQWGMAEGYIPKRPQGPGGVQMIGG